MTFLFILGGILMFIGAMTALFGAVREDLVQAIVGFGIFAITLVGGVLVIVLT